MSHTDALSEHDARVRAEVDAEVGRLAHWTRLLKQIDPHLELVRASHKASMPGLVPGYYHVLRNPPGGPVSIFCVQTPEGGFREPDSGLIESLERADLWNGRALKARQKREIEAAKEKERNREMEAADRILEYAERVASLDRLSVTFGGVRS